MKTTFKRKAFTLIELLIVIAIIGILFIVLVSKVDFATDKAKTTGVQTDFRSFQMAFETVSRENAGFNTLGWDIGDKTDYNLWLGKTTPSGQLYMYDNQDIDAGDRVRNSYDVGDANLNGELDSNETWTGRKFYTETWTSIYTLDNPGDATDKSAYILLEEAINKNLDPKLHITINPDTKEIAMANGYQDPWKTEYHGFYLSNATVDKMDRGAIIMYSNGPNKTFGSQQTISNGIVSINVFGNNIAGADDLSIVSIYTDFNNYGETKTYTQGFIQNQKFLSGNGNQSNPIINSNLPTENPDGSIDSYTWEEIKLLSQANLTPSEYKSKYGIEIGQKVDNKYVLVDLDGNNYDGFIFMYHNDDSGHPMNFTDTNDGGYVASAAAQYVNSLYFTLPSDLQAVIKEVPVRCNDGSNNYDKIHVESYYLFLPSIEEIKLPTTNTDGDLSMVPYLKQEGTKFDFFNSKEDRIFIGGPRSWWTRSAYGWYNQGFHLIAGGGDTYLLSTSPCEIVPCFVIG